MITVAMILYFLVDRWKNIFFFVRSGTIIQTDDLRLCFIWILMTLRLQSLELKIKRLDCLLVLLADIIIFSPKLTAIIIFNTNKRK